MWRLLVLLCACNQAFGIDETRGPDSDGDRVLDGTDNCTLVANANQRDGDRDGFGDACDPCIDGMQIALDGDGDGVDDACDPCLTGSNHDEDGDGALDGCDVCPADADDQADTDSDSVGDACDHAPGVVNARVLFDGFAPTRSDWKTGFQAWTNANGETYGPVPPLEGTWRGAWTRATLVPPTGWSMRAAMRVPTASEATLGDSLGIEAYTPEGGSTNRFCGIRRTATGWVDTTIDMPITVGMTVHVEIRERANPFASECYIDDVLVSTRSLGTPVERISMLRASAGTEFWWVDVVR